MIFATPDGRRGRSRALAGAFFLVAVASLWRVAAPARVAAAQSDLSFISASTWTADPGAGRIHVRAAITATSHTVDAAGRRNFYDHVQLTLPSSSAAFAAAAPDGGSLPVSVESVGAAGVVVSVGLPARLYSGQTGSIDFRFDLVDAKGSTERDLRISDNVISFPVWAFGSPMTKGSSVKVVFPAGFTVQQEFGGFSRAVLGSGQVVFSSGVVDDSTAVSAWFTAVQPVPASDFRSRSVSIGPLTVTLRYWVDDMGWADQVERVLRAGYPVMRGLIGLGDPAGTKLTVEEASSQEIGGFAGSYDPRSGHIVVSYFADPFVILHEVAHLWFNATLLNGRWLDEGFASYYAQQTVDRLGYSDHAPLLTDRMRADAVPLNDWADTGQPSAAVEAYLYGASLDIARRIAGEAGQPGLTSVWHAIRSGEAAYRPNHVVQTEVPAGGAADWRRLLDLLEQTTGHSYTAIWREWVVNPSQTGLLAQRATALAAYGEAQKTAGGWDLPPEIRQSLGTWQYGQAMAFIGQALGILAQRDQIAVEARTEETKPPPTLQATFERSGIGLASIEVTTELAVLSDLAAARQARTDSGGAAPAVGLLGVDPEADLDSARAAFAQGDLSRAMSLSSRARDAWQSAGNTGQVRIFGSLSVLAGLLLLLATFLWTRGGWRRRQAAMAAGTAVMGEVDPAATAAASSGRTEGTGAFGGDGMRASGPVARPHRNGGALAAAASGATHTTSAVGEAEEREARNPIDADGDLPLVDDAGAVGSEESAYELLQRGHALLRDRHNAQAAVVLERAARLELRRGSILEALGRAYFNSGQHARAAETFEALLEIDPSAHYGHFGLGLSFARLGRLQEAKTHLRLAAALDPASDTYRRALEKIEGPKG